MTHFEEEGQHETGEPVDEHQSEAHRQPARGAR